MSHPPTQEEVEIKLRLPTAEHGRALLQAHRFSASRPRACEHNTILDQPGQALRTEGQVLRIRQIDGQTVLTWKGPSRPARHKVREEQEVSLPHTETLATIFSRLGYEPQFVYEKYRTEYRRDSEPGLITLDETPVGCFLELEGDPAWIDATAAELGFTENDYLTASYGRLWADHQATHPTVGRDMIFVQNEPK